MPATTATVMATAAATTATAATMTATPTTTTVSTAQCERLQHDSSDHGDKDSIGS